MPVLVCGRIGHGSTKFRRLAHTPHRDGPRVVTIPVAGGVWPPSAPRTMALLGSAGWAGRIAPAARHAIRIHGNFESTAQKKVYALVGAAAAIAAAVGPLLGGFITTNLSWRVAFLLGAVIIAIVLSGIKLVRDVPYTGSRAVDVVGSVLSVLGMGGIVLSILVWQEGGESVAALLGIGAVALAGLAYWLVRRKRQRSRRCSTRICSSPSFSGSESPRGCSSRQPWAA
jgi:LPXTG-motif cell wall-anchored protein